MSAKMIHSAYLQKYSLSTCFLLCTFLLLMFNSMRLYFTWGLSKMLVYSLAFAACLFFMAGHSKYFLKTTYSNLALSFLLAIVYYYEMIAISEVGVLSFIIVFISVFCSIFLILSNIETKQLLLNFIIKGTAIIVLISLVGWGLFLIGVSLPHYYDETDIFYNHTVYYLFLLNGTPTEQIIPRFAGLFLEPGHIGTICVFLLAVNKFSIKKWENIIFFLAVLLSLSLAAYGLLIGGLALYLFLKSKKGFFQMLLLLLLFAGLWSFAQEYNNGDNYLNQKIFVRLVFEGGEMAGANRTTSFFDQQFNSFLETSKVWFGSGREVFDENGLPNLLNGCAGWKRYFFLRGIVGCALLLFFLISYYWKYRSPQGLNFLIIFIVANLIRDYPLREYWIFIYILIIPLLHAKCMELKLQTES